MIPAALSKHVKKIWKISENVIHQAFRDIHYFILKYYEKNKIWNKIENIPKSYLNYENIMMLQMKSVELNLKRKLFFNM